MSESFFEYELQACEDVRKKGSGREVYHWSVTPEDLLEDIGYIHDYNKKRLREIRKEHVLLSNGQRKNRINDYGADGVYVKRASSEIVECGLIQAKNWNDKSYLTASDLGSFLLVHGDVKCTHGDRTKSFLYTNADRLEINVRERMPRQNIDHVVLPYREEKEPTVETALSVEKLRPWQRDCIDSFSAEINDARFVIIAPCGAGKSNVSLFISKILAEKPDSSVKWIVVCAPIKSSVEQLKRTFPNVFPSSSSSSIEYKKIKIDSDSDGTTDVLKLGEFVDSNSGLENVRGVIFTTYASWANVVDPYFTENDLWDKSFLIVDEVHNFNRGHIDALEKIDRFLLMSATFPVELYEEIDDLNVYELSHQEALDQKLIVDYTIWIPGLVDGDTDETFSDITSLFSAQDKDVAMMANFLINGMLKTGSRRCMAFFNSQKECWEFNATFLKIMGEYHGISGDDQVFCNYIVDSTSKTERAEILDSFGDASSQRFMVLSSVRCLAESVDVPSCDSVFISGLSESSSDISLWQKSQRGSRVDVKNPNKRNNIFIYQVELDKSVGLFYSHDKEFHKKIRIVDQVYDKSASLDRKEIIVEKTESCRAFMNLQAVELLGSYESRSNEMMRKCVEWCLKTAAEKGFRLSDCKPSTRSKDREEKRFGTFLSHYRKALNGKGTKKLYESTNKIAIDGGCGHLLELLDFEKVSNEKMRECVAWCINTSAERGCRLSDCKPSQHSKDAEEQRLGKYLSRYRSAINGKGNGSRIYESSNKIAFDSGCGHLLELLDPEKVSNENMRKCVEWCKRKSIELRVDVNKCKPSLSSNDPMEKKLAKFLAHYRENTNKKYNSVKVYSSTTLIAIESGCGHLLESLESKSNQMMTKCVEWCLKKSRELQCDVKECRPSSVDNDSEEKRLEQWLSWYRKSLNGKRGGNVYESTNRIARDAGCGHLIEVVGSKRPRS